MAQMDFGLARLNHQVWKMRLRSFINGREEMNESEAVSYRDCDLGKWMYGGALDKYHNVPEMARLDTVHTTLHRQIKAIVLAKNKGNVAEAKEMFKEIGPLSVEVVQLLTDIEQKTLLTTNN